MPQTGTEKRKIPRRRPEKGEWVEVRMAGSDADHRADVIDVSDAGIGLACDAALPQGTSVRVRFDGEKGSRREARGVVVWCRKTTSGAFRAGIQFESGNSGRAKHGPVEASPDSSDPYEVLQVHPKADIETVHRVFRLLAQRYHPDNPETGNDQFFRQLLEAYNIIGDPERRASYDAVAESHRDDRLRIFQDWQSSVGVEGERRKRAGILAALYRKRAADPHNPGVAGRELEDGLGCPKEHLEFALWYLRESGYIGRSDNNRYTITAKGVELAEQNESEAVRVPISKLLPGR